MQSLQRRDLLVWVCISLWVLVMVSTPIFTHILGDPILNLVVSSSVILQATAVGIIFWRGTDWRTTLRRIIPIVPIAWLIELIGSKTGLPFGTYHYTEILQPQIMGIPLLIPLAWMMMLPPSWAIATLVVKSQKPSMTLPVRLTRAGVSALAFTAWDLLLDPQMVSWHLWWWSDPGAYFGIPAVNYIGWLIVSFVITFFMLPAQIPEEKLFILYAITWLLQSIALVFFWRLPGPGICGFVGMGVMILWACLRRKQWKKPF